jgi:hypothetical protein
MSTEFNIGFDNSHYNKLIIEDPGFNDFIEFLFNSDLKLGKIEAGLTYEKLSVYNIFIIGVPTSNYKLDSDEIDDLVKYVKDGGSLMIINDKGGEYENKNNLNDLTQHFGIQFNSDQLFDNEHYSKDVSRPIIKNFKKHFITKDITQFIHSGGCTLRIDKSIETDEINVIAIAFSSEETSWHKYYNPDEEEWIDEPVSKAPITAVTHFGLGKVVAIGNLSLFSSFHKLYGIHAADNFKLISNIISWLLNKAHSKKAQLTQPIYTTIPIKQDLFYWIKEKLDEGRWKSIEEAINFALNVVKIRMTEKKEL